MKPGQSSSRAAQQSPPLLTYCVPVLDRIEAHRIAGIVRESYPQAFVQQYLEATGTDSYYVVVVPRITQSEANELDSSCIRSLATGGRVYGIEAMNGRFTPDPKPWLRMALQPLGHRFQLWLMAGRARSNSASRSRREPSPREIVRGPSRLGWVLWRPNSRANWKELVAGWEEDARVLRAVGADTPTIRREIWKNARRAWWPLAVDNAVEALRLLELVRRFTNGPPRAG